jgi:hypothetical protein
MHDQQISKSALARCLDIVALARGRLDVVLKVMASNPACWVISLNSEEGNARKKRLNFQHELHDGVLGSQCDQSWRSRFSKGRYKITTFEAVVGGFQAHLNVWKEVAKLPEGQGVVVLEDDAYQLRPIPGMPTMNRTHDQSPGIVLLGGALRYGGIWEEETKSWVKNNAWQETFAALKEGYNPMTNLNTKKWTMCISYFLDAGTASMLVKEVAKGGRLRAVDVWLNGYTRGLIFPNVFMDHPDSVSQCNSKKSHLGANFYMPRFLQSRVLMLDARSTYSMWQTFMCHLLGKDPTLVDV